MVLVRDGDVLMFQGLVVEVDHFELFPGLIRTFAERQQGPPFLATPAAFFFHFLTPLELLGVRDDRHHHAIAAGVDTRGSRALRFIRLERAVLRLPSGGERGRLLRGLHHASFRFHQASQLFATQRNLCQAGHVLGGLSEAGGRLVLAATDSHARPA